MINVNFYLKNKNSKVETLIYVKFGYKGKTYKRSTKLKIRPTDWDLKRQKAKSNYVHVWTINDNLQAISNGLVKVYKTLLANDKIADFTDFDNVLSELTIFDNIESDTENEQSFLEIFEYFIKVKDVSEYRKVKYNSTLKHLISYEKHANYILKFERINENFFVDFCNYLFDIKILVNSTVGSYIKVINTFMTWSLKNQYHTNRDYQEFTFNYNVKTAFVYLTSEERLKIENLNLSENKRLENVRDVFILACYTGLRYSDLENLKTANIQNDLFVFTAKKNQKQQIIPFTTQSKKIIDKYKDKPDFLNVISNQNFNEYLKEIGEIAEINTPFEKVIFRKNNRVEKTAPKYEFITTHTARRTFGTLYLQDGGDIVILKEIFGHSKIETTMRYLQYTASDIKKNMKKVFKETETNPEIIRIAKKCLQIILMFRQLAQSQVYLFMILKT